MSRAQSRVAAMVVAAMCVLIAAGPTRAQNRPLQTADAEIVPAGTMRTTVGFDFLQNVDFPLSGLTGDLTSVGVIRLRLGVGKMIEVQLAGAAQNFLSIKNRGASFVDLSTTSANSTRDTGDFSMLTKIRLFEEKGRRPGLAFQFGFVMPNSNQVRGIGTNTTDIFAGIILQKKIWRMTAYGNLGIAILQSPLENFSQNDVLTYGAAFVLPLHKRVNLAGEVFGRYSSRKVEEELTGTESRSQARLGLQIFAGGFQWDVAGIAGLTKIDARSGFTFGVSKDVRLFDWGSK